MISGGGDVLDFSGFTLPSSTSASAKLMLATTEEDGVDVDIPSMAADDEIEVMAFSTFTAFLFFTALVFIRGRRMVAAKAEPNGSTAQQGATALIATSSGVI
jgi:hypothetical protein